MLYYDEIILKIKDGFSNFFVKAFLISRYVYVIVLSIFYFEISGFDSHRSRSHTNMKNLQDPSKPQKPDEPNPCLPITTVSFQLVVAGASHFMHLFTY